MSDLDTLQKSLSLKFKNQNLLLTALTHRSFLNEDKKAKISNERLEFLGDSVLSILVSTELYNRFESFPEGKLTSLRSLLVKTKTLADLAHKLDLGSYLLMSKGEEKSGGRDNPSLLADTFEAVLGAIYLDAGIKTANDFLTKHLFPMITEVEQNSVLTDYKSALQEETQERSKQSPTYKVLTETGPDHEKTFTVGVYLTSELLASGQGRSKQEAEQNAAKLALGALKMVK